MQIDPSFAEAWNGKGAVLCELEKYDEANGNGNIYDDDYYIEIGSEHPRFADYREKRGKITDAFGNKTCEDVWDRKIKDSYG